MMKKLLIIGASILQLPAIVKAKEMGFTVAVADYNPKAIGIRYADQYFNVSTIDIHGVTAIAKTFRPDGIMTLATDMPMRAIAAACQACGLPGIGYETAVKATDKGEMIKAFEKYKVEHPWYYIAMDQTAFESLIHSVTFPCIMKPIDNAGSRGVVLCHDEDMLKKEYEYSRREARNGAVIIEEYLQGPEFSVEVMVIEGEPYVLQITDKMTTGAPHFVEMGHSQPSRECKENQEKIGGLACRAVKAVGIPCGPAHVEVILTAQGPKMVELGARMGGDCITTHLVPLSTGIDMVKCTIEIACGMQVDISPKFKKASAIKYFETPSGILVSIDGVEEAKELPGIREISFVKTAGERVKAIGNSGDRIGFVIAQAKTPEQAMDACTRAMEKVLIRVK